MALFEDAIQYVLSNEGVDSDDKADRGGRTRFGITRETARRHGLDVTKLTIEQAKEIYRRDYWMFDAVTDQRVATKMLDMVVNFGAFGGVKIIQKAIGVAPTDGVFGKLTTGAVNKTHPEDALERLSIGAAEQYVGIVRNDESQLRFLLGWIRRAIKRPPLLRRREDCA